MQRLIATLLLVLWPGILLKVDAQRAVFFSQNVSASSGCTSPPTMTYRWPVYSTGSGAVSSLTDVVGGNTATQGTPANQPGYVASAVNGLPALSFDGTHDLTLVLNTSISATTSAFTYFAVFKLAATGSNYALLSGTSGAVEWRINSSGKQEFLSSGVSSLGTGATTFSAGTWYTVAVTYNTSTGGQLYICSGGTCSTDGAALSATTFSQPMTNFGFATAAGDRFNGSIAEWGFKNSVSTTGIGAYSLACYAI